MSSITHTEGSSVSQQTGVGDAPNIIIMENNIINCGDPNYIHLTSHHHHHLHNTQQTIVGNKKGPKQTVTSQNKFNKTTAVNKQIITNTNLITTSKEKVFNVQTGRGPKTMYTQQVYTTIPSSPTSSANIVQQQKITTMPRNVQVVTKGSNNMILCRSPSNNSGSSNGNTQIQIQEQQYHHIDSQPQQAYTTMKTIYVNNNSGGLNLNKSNKIMTSISPLDYSSETIKQPQTKYITQKVVQPSPNSDMADNKYAFKFTTTSVSSPSTSGQQTQVVQQQNSSGNSNKGMIKNYNNNCTVKSIQQTSQPAFYYQPTTVYTSDAINYKTSSATLKGNTVGKNQGQQYIQVSQNHRISTNNYTPAPVQKHRTSSSSSSGGGKYIIQSVAPPSQNNPVSSSQVRYTTTTNNQTSVISYSPEQPSVIQSPIKMRTVLHPIESTGMEDGARIYTVSEAHPDEVDSSSNSTPKSYNSTNFSENYMIVNGTKMTDEMSARILHDLSQRSSVKYNNINSTTNNNQHNSSNSVGGGGSEIIQISQQQSGTIYSARQPDGTTVVWNSSATSMNPSETKYLTTTQEQLTSNSNSNRKISESSNNYVNASPAYQHDYRGVNNR